MKRKDEQDDLKFDRKTKALRRMERIRDEEREANQEIERYIRDTAAPREAASY